MSQPETFGWPFFRLFVDGAAASCIAEALTLPFEVSKMRLQLQRSDKQLPRQTRYTGMVHAFQTIVKEEKWHSLFKGLESGLHKQILYTGLRLGLYDYLTGLSGEEVSMPAKVACATMTTGIGILLANPSDVVQTRFIAYRSLGASQSSGASSGSPGVVSRAPVSGIAAKPATQQRRHSSSLSSARAPYSGAQRHISSPAFQHQKAAGGLRFCAGRLGVSQQSCLQSVDCIQSSCKSHLRGSHTACGVNTQNCTAGGPKSVTGVPLSSARSAYGVILREEGLVNGLYRGIAANLSCSCVQGAAEITTYDFTKEAAMRHGFADSMPLHLAAGMAAGLVATVLSNPLDVVATRMMAAKNTQCVQKGTLTTIIDIWRCEGIGAFFSGFGPNILRIGSFNIVLWLSYEQIRKLGREPAVAGQAS